MTSEPTVTLEDLWRQHRRRVLDVAYRMLGSVADAEDVAAEAYLRLAQADLDAIDDPVGWLVAVTGRIAIDRLRAAEHRRRAYVGPWLPEPLLAAADPTAVDPADRITLDDSVRMALLVVLEQLSPAERTAFVLHDVFSVPFTEVGAIVGRSPAACRQLAHRARRRIAAAPDTARPPVDRAQLEAVARRFADACAAGTIERLLEVLDPDVTGDFDSGGLIPGAPLTALDGAELVAATLVAAFAGRGCAFEVVDVNGAPGVVVRLGDRVAAVVALGVHDGRVDLIHAVGNPAKLRHLDGG